MGSRGRRRFLDAWKDTASGLDADSRGTSRRRRSACSRPGDALNSPALRNRADELLRELASSKRTIGSRRKLAASGQVARARLVALRSAGKLAWPQRGTRRDRYPGPTDGRHQDRLARVRELVAAGQLQDASALLPGLAREKDDAEVGTLSKEVRRRMELANKGLSQVRRALHGGQSASRKGLEHCIGRLQELQKLQTDNRELNELTVQLQTEHQGLLLLEAMRPISRAVNVSPSVSTWRSSTSLRSGFLDPGRLDGAFSTSSTRCCRRWTLRSRRVGCWR